MDQRERERKYNLQSASTEIDVKADFIERKMVEKWVCGKTKFLIRSLVVQWENQSSLDACITVIRPWPSQALLSFCPITPFVSFLIFLPNYTLLFQKFIPFIDRDGKLLIFHRIDTKFYQFLITNIFIIRHYCYILRNNFQLLLLNIISISNEIFRKNVNVFIR